ncbi:sigma-54-dependent Fis family transcriptional regulator [candidate division KSB1 bacterium]|nr:MAG: sigma-54-dependent Fis family transcriptional regulator [candidate division KSB1 bacterium]
MNNIEQKTASLLELAVTLCQQTDFQEILRLISAKTSMLFNASIASIMMINPRTNETIKTIIKMNKVSTRQRYQLAQTSVTGLVLHEKRSFLSGDITKDARFREGLFEDQTVRSVMCVPLQTGGAIIGCLLLFDKAGNGAFDQTELDLLESMAAICAPFLSNAQKIQVFFEAPLPDEVLLNKYKSLGLLGKSRPFVELLRTVEAAARCDVRVFLEGKTGTGKELIARAIHRLSGRNQHPFVAADCGAIPADLIESELFGHVKGAFTGATQDRKGLFIGADKGSLFLDEIANLPSPAQTKLMRVLQENEVRPLGSDKVHKIDVRIIAASSSSLEDMMAKHQFREDLFYRLVVYPIHVQTLEQRQQDIPLLASHFLEKHARRQRKKVAHFHFDILEFMKQQKWPGNIRELDNFVERLVTLSAAEATMVQPDILPKDLSGKFRQFESGQDEPHVSQPLKERLLEYEKQIIHQALLDNDWNQSAAARELKMSEQLMRYRMKKFDIVRPLA